MESIRPPGRTDIPGKILFFGGYSVLEPRHLALSFAVFDRIGHGVTASVKTSKVDRLVARQFQIDERIDSHQLIKKNVAVRAFQLTKLYLDAKGYSGINTITLTNSPIFGIKHKSGLGSSAASTVAVVKSLFKANGIDPYAHMETIHKLSQYSYAATTAKVGSGFDIATCAMGHTIFYNRFDPASIELPPDFQNEKATALKLLESVDRPWPSLLIRPVEVPSKYGILFFKIEGGATSSVTNVRAVSLWKGKYPAEYSRLMTAQDTLETEGVKKFLEGDNNSVQRLNNEVRKIHRKLQQLVAILVPEFDPIEPQQLKEVINFAESVPGIVAGRCPGAGGWDGLAFIVDKRRFKENGVNDIVKKGSSQKLKLRRIHLRFV